MASHARLMDKSRLPLEYSAPIYASKRERFKTGLAPRPMRSMFLIGADACRPVGRHPNERGNAMRKIVIGSGLGLVAAAFPAHGAVLPIAVQPSGVSEAGRIAFAAQGTDTQGVLIGLSKPGEVQDKQGPADNKFNPYHKSQDAQVKLNPYDKMNAQAQLKIKGESQLKLNGDGLKTGNQIKSPADSQIKIKSGAQLKTGVAGVQCDALGDGSVRPGQ